MFGDSDYFEYDSVTPPDRPPSSELDIAELLERSQKHERERLFEQLDRIDQQLSNRRAIHDETIEEIESKIEWYVDRLETLYRRPTTERDEREKLKNRIAAFYRDRREEKQSFWQDKQQLERERRTVLRELSELDTDEWLSEFL